MGLWNEPLETDLAPVDDIKIQVRFGNKYIQPFYIIVETYEHKNYGRGKRLYLQEFTKQERRIISEYHAKLYKWFMRTGVPVEGVVMKLKTYSLLQRASNFFSDIQED